MDNWVLIMKKWEENHLFKNLIYYFRDLYFPVSCQRFGSWNSKQNETLIVMEIPKCRQSLCFMLLVNLMAQFWSYMQ